MNPKKEFDNQASFEMSLALHHIIDEMSIVYELHVVDVIGVLETMKLEIAIRNWTNAAGICVGGIHLETNDYLH